MGGVGPGGAEGEGVDFLYFIVLYFIYAMEIEGGQRDTKLSIIKHSNESRRYASNLKTKGFNFKYHITPENTKY